MEKSYQQIARAQVLLFLNLISKKYLVRMYYLSDCTSSSLSDEDLKNSWDSWLIIKRSLPIGIGLSIIFCVIYKWIYPSSGGDSYIAMFILSVFLSIIVFILLTFYYGKKICVMAMGVRRMCMSAEDRKIFIELHRKELRNYLMTVATIENVQNGSLENDAALLLFTAQLAQLPTAELTGDYNSLPMSCWLLIKQIYQPGSTRPMPMLAVKELVSVWVKHLEVLTKIQSHLEFFSTYKLLEDRLHDFYPALRPVTN